VSRQAGREQKSGCESIQHKLKSNALIGPAAARSRRVLTQVGESPLIASELHCSGDMQFSANGVLCIIEIPSGEALIHDE
jgi:hypothetical protein